MTPEQWESTVHTYRRKAEEFAGRIAELDAREQRLVELVRESWNESWSIDGADIGGTCDLYWEDSVVKAKLDSLLHEKGV